MLTLERRPKFKYRKTIKDLTPKYADFVAAGVRVLVFSGDTDACVPFKGTTKCEFLFAMIIYLFSPFLYAPRPHCLPHPSRQGWRNLELARGGPNVSPGPHGWPQCKLRDM